MSNEREQRERVSGRKRAEEHKSSGTYYLNVPEDASTFKNDKKGVRKIDILPYRVTKGSDVIGGNPNQKTGKLYFERTFFVHARMGADESSYICPAKTANQKCPICEARTKMAKDSSVDQELVKSLLPKERQLWNVIDLEDADKGVQIWDVSYHIFGKRLDKEVKNSDEEDGYEWYADLEEGSSLKLGIDEKPLPNGKYMDVETINFKRRKPYDRSILEKTHDLDAMLIILPYDKLKQIFLQSDDTADDEDADEWDTPAPKKEKAETKAAEEKKEEPKQETKPSKPKNSVDCPACDGEGKSSKGRACVPCGGHGYLTKDEDDEPSTKKEEPKKEVSADDDWDKQEPIKKQSKSDEKKETVKSGAKGGDDDWDNWDK